IAGVRTYEEHDQGQGARELNAATAGRVATIALPPPLEPSTSLAGNRYRLEPALARTAVESVPAFRVAAPVTLGMILRRGGHRCRQVEPGVQADARGTHQQWGRRDRTSRAFLRHHRPNT